MSQPLPLVITGAAGRMGRALVETIQRSTDVELAVAVEHSRHPAVGQDAGRVAGLDELGVRLRGNLEASLRPGQVVVDFTLASATEAHLAACLDAGCGLVIGTTGHDDRQRKLIRSASRELPIVFSPNMSIGVNLCFNLLKLAAGVLGEESDIEILEMHHRYKVDAPSGTALGMGQVIADALGRDLDAAGVYERAGHTGVRKPGSIGFQSLRGGDVIGEHTVTFAAEGERVEVSHKASSRVNFARGALRAALYLRSRQAGLYDMQDVLGLSS